MTGTSLDALDVALVAIDGTGWSLRAEWIAGASRPLGPLAAPLRSLASQAPLSVGTIARLVHDFSWLHARTIRDFVAQRAIDLVAAHGQTVFHAPPVSWQLLNPTPIAHALQVPVVCDLRAADLAAGGQGAPITPVADYLLFADEREPRAVVNLGGFCNITCLPARRRRDGGSADDLAAIRALDVCACNHLLDGLARRLLGQPHDENGCRAGTGQVIPTLRDELLEWLRTQAASNRSLGTGDELDACVRRAASAGPAADVLRSACEALATVIVETVRSAAAREQLAPPERYLLAGGGTRNRVLVAALTAHARGPAELTEAHGVPAAYREAAAMAVLGALCQDGVPITLPAVTGVESPAPLAGVWAFPTRARAAADTGRKAVRS